MLPNLKTAEPFLNAIESPGRPRNTFWAVQALGSLDFDKDKLARERAEQTLLKLLDVKGHDTDFDGLALMGSESGEKAFLSALKGGSGREWQAARALLTLGPSLKRFEAFRELLSKEEGFSSALRYLNYYRKELKTLGKDEKQLFTEIASGYFRFYYDAGENALTSHPSLLASVMTFMPPECHW